MLLINGDCARGFRAISCLVSGITFPVPRGAGAADCELQFRDAHFTSQVGGFRLPDGARKAEIRN